MWKIVKLFLKVSTPFYILTSSVFKFSVCVFSPTPGSQVAVIFMDMTCGISMGLNWVSSVTISAQNLSMWHSSMNLFLRKCLFTYFAQYYFKSLVHFPYWVAHVFYILRIEIYYQKLFRSGVFYLFLVILQLLLTMLTNLISVPLYHSETVIYIKMLHDKYCSIYVGTFFSVLCIEIYYQKLFRMVCLLIFSYSTKNSLLIMLTILISVPVCLSETVIHIKILHYKYYNIYVNSSEYDIIVIIYNNSPNIGMVLSDKTYRVTDIYWLFT